jgi:hypothetical protein
LREAVSTRAIVWYAVVPVAAGALGMTLVNSINRINNINCHQISSLA